MGLLSSCWDGSAGRGGGGGVRPGGGDRLSAETALMIYLFICLLAGRALRKASLLGRVSSPTSSDEPAPGGRWGVGGGPGRSGRREGGEATSQGST